MQHDKITNIKKENITAQIYTTLKGFIISETWPSGFRIPSETELAKQFGVSRMSVRMAMQRLQVMGLVDVRVGDGSFVKSFSLSEYLLEVGNILLHSKTLLEIAQFRKCFELEALRLAIDKYTPEQLGILNSYLKQLLQCVIENDNEKFIEADFKFHRYILTMSGNSIFETLYDIGASMMVDYYKANRQISPISSDSDLAQEDHALLFRAICERDYEKSKQIYINLIDYVLVEEMSKNGQQLKV